MTCPLQNENPEFLMDFAAGSLDAVAMQKMELHVATCVECKGALDAQTAVWKALDEWEAMPVSIDFDAKLYERIDQQHSTVWGRLKSAILPTEGWMNWRPAMSVAAVCLVLFGAFVLRVPDLDTSFDNEEIAAITLEAHEIEQAEKVLEDVEMVGTLTAEVKLDQQAL